MDTKAFAATVHQLSVHFLLLLLLGTREEEEKKNSSMCTEDRKENLYIKTSSVMTALCWVVPVTRFCLAPFLDQLPQMCRLLYNHQKNLRWRLPVVGHNFKKKIFSFLFLL